MFPFGTKILFGCNQCGECCRQVQVPLCHEDLLRLLIHFEGRPLDDWLHFHPIESTHPDALYLNGRSILLTLRTHLPDGGCRMLVDNSCSIYEVRPIVCKTFPFQLQRNQLKISPEFQLLVSLACEKEPYKEHRTKRQEIQRSEVLFIKYRKLVQQWNQETANTPDKQSFERFVNFLKQMMN